MSEKKLSAEQNYREAFERLKSGNPQVLARGMTVTQNNVAREAGQDPTALKKARFPLLVLEIQDYIKQQTSSEELEEQKKSLRKKRTLEERLKACQSERDQLTSICEAQLNLIEQFQDEISDLKRGISKPIPIK